MREQLRKMRKKVRDNLHGAKMKFTSFPTSMIFLSKKEENRVKYNQSINEDPTHKFVLL